MASLRSKTRSRSGTSDGLASERGVLYTQQATCTHNGSLARVVEVRVSLQQAVPEPGMDGG
eukprot:4406877-Amphidinium_carterae.1